MSDLLSISSRIIDNNEFETNMNRMTLELSQVADHIGFIEAFSNVIALRTLDGLVIIDTSLEELADACISSLRTWSAEKVHSIIYTHGHIDHVGGAGKFLNEAQKRAQPRPHVIGHQQVLDRFERYKITNGYNKIINSRQFSIEFDPGTAFLPGDCPIPDNIVQLRKDIKIGGLTIEVFHEKGETDDHIWGYIPEYQAIFVGDLVMPHFPNAGNPQKQQRYPLEWARALRRMANKKPNLMLPSHGLPVSGESRIAGILEKVAAALEELVEQTLQLMNEGATLDTVIHSVKLRDDFLRQTYLYPVYDEPEFVVRNIWRLYGGWYDGNPAHLKPARESDLAKEWVQLSGGIKNVVRSAKELLEKGELRLATHLIQSAAFADPENLEVHEVREQVFRRRRERELSLMAKGIFGAAVSDSSKLIAKSKK